MDEPGEPSISDMLKQNVSKFEDKLQTDLLIYDLDESLENETYQSKPANIFNQVSDTPQP